jgi:hypothetical protein
LHQRLTTLATGAAVGLVPVLDTRQLHRQGLTAGAFAFGLLGGRQRRPHVGRLTLLLQVGFAGGEVGGQAFFEEVPFGQRQRLALHAEFHPPQIEQFEGELLDLGIAPVNFGLASLEFFEQSADPIFGPQQQFRRGREGGQVRWPNPFGIIP